MCAEYEAQGFGSPYMVADGFFVQYESLKAEFCIGGVYVRLFLKEPSFNLRDPRRFVEALMAKFFEECEKQLPQKSGISMAVAVTSRNAVGSGEAIVIAGEDLCTMTTNAIVCVLKV